MHVQDGGGWVHLSGLGQSARQPAPLQQVLLEKLVVAKSLNKFPSAHHLLSEEPLAATHLNITASLTGSLLASGHTYMKHICEPTV
jgi:hypothetical protein